MGKRVMMRVVVDWVFLGCSYVMLGIYVMFFRIDI